MRKTKSPAQYVVDRLGGGSMRETARVLGYKSPSTVLRWFRAKGGTAKGSAGALSANAQARAIAAAKKKGIRLDLAKLVDE